MDARPGVRLFLQLCGSDFRRKDMSMKSNSPRRRTPAVKSGNGNGHGKATAATPPSARSDEQVLEEQPRIADLLGAGSRRGASAGGGGRMAAMIGEGAAGLSKVQLLEALAAFK